MRPGDPGTRGTVPAVVFKEEQVANAITQLANGKGLGPDGNEAEIVKAAAPVSTRVMTAILNDVGEFHYVPVGMRGGRIAELYKGKGDSKDPNNYRGLLLSDHQTKILTGILQDEVSDAYYSYIHAEQFGATRKRGTDFAAHLTSCFIQYCMLSSLSCFILFVDLSKAFDMVIREVLMSFKQSFTDDPISCLEAYGLHHGHAAALAGELQEKGSLLDQLGVDKGITELLKSVHTESWFVRTGSDNAIVTSRGGRQGCKLGSIVFNLIYSRALRKLRERDCWNMGSYCIFPSVTLPPSGAAHEIATHSRTSVSPRQPLLMMKLSCFVRSRREASKRRSTNYFLSSLRSSTNLGSSSIGLRARPKPF